MIALPDQLFYTTGIPVCLWFLTRNKSNGKFRDRRHETLFIDARKMGRLTRTVCNQRVYIWPEKSRGTL
jgi:type I restriction enzyme M protein